MGVWLIDDLLDEYENFFNFDNFKHVNNISTYFLTYQGIITATQKYVTEYNIYSTDLVRGNSQILPSGLNF